MSIQKINRAIISLNRKAEKLEEELAELKLDSPARAHVQGQIKGLRYSITLLDVIKKAPEGDAFMERDSHA